MRVAGETNAGLLVVGSRGRGKLGSAILGSVAIRLAAEARTPVVVLPPGAVVEGGGHYDVAEHDARQEPDSRGADAAPIRLPTPSCKR